MKTDLPIGEKITIHVLNDLIRINIDRITGFEKASHEEKTPEPELREAFYRMAVEGRSYVNELHARVIRLGGAPVTQATITGKVYLRWLEGKPQFDGPDSLVRLAACHAAGVAAEQAYRHVLEEPLPPDLHELIENQLWSLERADQRLENLRASFDLKK